MSEHEQWEEGSEELPEPEVTVVGGTSGQDAETQQFSAVEEIPPAEAGAEALPVEETAPLEIEPETPGVESEGPEEVPVLEMEPEAVEPGPQPEPGLGTVARKPAPGPEPPLVEVVPARVGWGRLIFVGLLSAILGAFLALLFLFMVNGTLDFQRAAVQAAQNEVLRLEDELDALGGKLAQMEAQVAAVQELDRRLAAAEASLGQVATELQATQAEMETMVATMDVLRQEFTNLREDLDGLAGHVSALEGRLGGVEEQLASLSQEVEALGETVLRFDAFLTGLRELLDQAAGALPPTPAAQAMPTLRPSVTVIPLVTPTAPAP